MDTFVKLSLAADKQAKVADGALLELREEVGSLRAQLLSAQQLNLELQRQAAVDKANFDWLKAKVNQLEFERAALIRETSNISLPVPQIMQNPPQAIEDAGAFEDIGDELARQLHLDQFADKGDDFRD